MPDPLRLLLTLLIAATYAGGLTLAHGTLAHGTPAHGTLAHGPDADLARTASEAHDHADEHDLGHEGEHGHDDHDHDRRGDHDTAEGTRLLIASADAPTLVVLDLGSGEEIARFTVPGPGRVHQLPDARHAVVLHPDQHRVTVVHSGLSAVDHGDHADLVEGVPHVLKTLNLGRQPTAFFALGTDIAVLAEQDGTVAWLDARLLGISLDYVEVATGQAAAGAVSIVDGHVVVGRPGLDRIEVYGRDGALLERLDACPDLGGQAVHGRAVALGCSDGVLIVELDDDGAVSWHTIGYPEGSFDGARVDALVGDGAGALVGSFGDGLALVDVDGRTIGTLGLAAAPIAMQYAVDGMLVVLTADGWLHRLEVETGHIASVEAVRPTEARRQRPGLAVLGAFAYVADTEHDRVVEVHLDDMDVERRFDLPFTPGGMAVMAIPGALLH